MNSSILQQCRSTRVQALKEMFIVLHIYNGQGETALRSPYECWKIKFKNARSQMRRRKKMRASQGKSSSSAHMPLRRDLRRNGIIARALKR